MMSCVSDTTCGFLYNDADVFDMRIIVGGIGGLIAALLIFDLFFTAFLWPIEQPMMEMIAEVTSSI